MGKYISGFATRQNLKQWQDYSARNGQETARKSEGPTRENTGDPSNVRYIAQDGGLVRRTGVAHKYPDLKAGGCSGEGRIALANAQARKR